MLIAPNKVVTIDYTLTDADGNIIDRSEAGGFAYLHGARNIISGLETALAGRSAGDELSVSVSPEDAYGERDASKLHAVPLSLFPDTSEVEVGMQFHAQGPEGQNILVTVASVDGEQVTVDGNHPLAGVTLNFAVKVVDVRDATDEELQHGHVHGPAGHHH